MGTKRLVELEKELDKTSEKYRTMFLKYSFAFSRKDEYKDCYYKLRKASEKEKERLEKQKQKLEESVVKWRTKAELEENRKLKLNLDYLKSEKEIEAAEGRATELMAELINIRLKHDTEINNMRESYENTIKEEQKQKDQFNKDIIEKNQEIKNQRMVCGEKMTEVR